MSFDGMNAAIGVSFSLENRVYDRNYKMSGLMYSHFY